MEASLKGMSYDYLIDELQLRSQDQKHELSAACEASVRNRDHAGRNGASATRLDLSFEPWTRYSSPGLGKGSMPLRVGGRGLKRTPPTEPTWHIRLLVEVDLSFVDQMEAGTVEGSLPMNVRETVGATDDHPVAIPLCRTRVAGI